MKITYTVIMALLIIGAGVIVVKRDFNKDMTIDTNSNVANEGGAITTITTETSTSSVSNQVSVSTNGSSNVTTGNSAHVTNSDAVDWEGKYQIVEFGNVISDSSPMAYDAYGYTDIEIVFMHDKGVEVTMSQRTGTGTPRPIYGTGRITPEGEFEILSPTGSVLLTLKQGDFGANTDTQITWGTLSPVLQTTTNKFVHVRKESF